MAKIYLDGENIVRGRLASYAAKEALKGNDVFVLNCEKVLISGTEAEIINDFKTLRRMNTIKPEKGPFLSRTPERIVKRCVRGMVPDFRRARGKVAINKVKCYVGIPDEFKKEKLIKIKSNIPKKYITVGKLSRLA